MTGPVTAPEPGWYRDPSDARRHRYWDGEQWLSQCQRLRGQGRGGACADEEE